ncbi:NAD(P)/FAD-dependent oxidoreductase [Arthrobacter sp. MSA 4-2]|uniref:NAD(P)/FAD-dependent oxidoreductase n=1 Tax=Arthrobacter sp. MSA 4-2 TaxID=2794349 RepID=UPI0018E7CCDE|nr:NAD(P)/FAD-dependent oxidoreductase [Arthrobacter sp. MSA 4-2]MBJ2121495.1 NAD(P)/FAD-dependent oxidoreductase [Arthrobacter sp. MSA 4-2]
MKKILIVGAGYAGFYTAWKLEKSLRKGEAEVTVVDPRPYMTYQPFLPEVTAGSVEARHVAISLRRHLRRTTVIAGSVTSLDHAHRTATVMPLSGLEQSIHYDTVVVTAGAVSRVFPIPGVADYAIGLKTVEEAVAIRDQLMTAFDRASTMPMGPERRKALTVTVVGGGFSGVELFGELLSLAHTLEKSYPGIEREDLNFHLIEANKRILPEVTDGPGRWVVRHLTERGGTIHLNTQLTSAIDGHIVLSDGKEYDSDMLVWAAGNAANPVVAAHTDLPIDERGYLRVRADLRVGPDDSPIEGAWGAGDNASVPDLASSHPGARTVPNAQHSVRQGKLLAKNLAADLRGEPLRQYRHSSLGVVATLGLGMGVFQFRRIIIKGFPAWVMHRGYHVLAVPTWERKIRVLLVWTGAALFGRDIVSIQAVQHPRDVFTASTKPSR